MIRIGFYSFLAVAFAFAGEFSDDFGIEWEKQYGSEKHDEIKTFIKSKHGGYILAGYTEGYGNEGNLNNVWLLRTDQNGDTLWTKSYGKKKWHETAHFLSEEEDGSIFLVCSQGDDLRNNEEVLIIHTDKNGDTLWTKNYCKGFEPFLGPTVKTSEGNFIIASRTEYLIQNDFICLIICVDKNGTQLWQKVYGDSIVFKDWRIYAMTQIEGTNEFLATGHLNGKKMIMKFDDNGDTLWVKTYVGINNYYTRSIVEISNKRFIIAGCCDSNTSTQGDYLFCCIDSSGTLLWSRTYGTEYNEYVNNSVKNSDGSVLVVGTRIYGKSYSKCWVLRLNTNGDTLWTSEFGNFEDVYGLAAMEIAPKEYIIAGSCSDSLRDGWIVKIKETIIDPIIFNIGNNNKQNLTKVFGTMVTATPESRMKVYTLQGRLLAGFSLENFTNYYQNIAHGQYIFRIDNKIYRHNYKQIIIDHK